MVERGRLGGAERGGVFEDAIAGVGVPGGHALREEGLADGGGFGGEVSELAVDVRRDVARGMAGNAAGQDDRGDFGGVVGNGRCREVERRGCGAHGNTLASGGSAAGNEGGDGVGGEVLGRGGEGGGVGVVEGAAVGEDQADGIDHEHFELAGDAKFAGDELGLVDQDGHGVVEERLLGDDRGPIGGEVGIDLPEGDVGDGKARAEGAEGAGGLEGARPAGGGEDEDDGLRGGFVIEFAAGAGVIGEAEIGDEAAGGETARGFSGREDARVEGAGRRMVHGAEG